LETGFICLAYNHNKLQQVSNSYHCLNHTQGTLNLHPSGAGLPSNLPASVRMPQSLVDLLVSRNLHELELLNWTELNSAQTCCHWTWQNDNLSNYGRTAKETPISTSSVSLACALPCICASTSRLPRNFHIRWYGKLSLSIKNNNLVLH
jgi:hypothetical protein